MTWPSALFMITVVICATYLVSKVMDWAGRNR